MEMVRNEALFLERLSLEVVMRLGQHVWLECEPTDIQRLIRMLPAIRARHPDYRVAVIDIKVDEEPACLRHRDVIRQTGRGTLNLPNPAPDTDIFRLGSMA